MHTGGCRLSREGDRAAVDVLGPSIQFLSSLEGDQDSLCLLKGVIPPGISVPLHSHPDEEHFYMVSGDLEVFLESSERGWNKAAGGDFLQITGSAKHAFRNRSDECAILLVQTTIRMGNFFREIGVPGRAYSDAPVGPSPDALQRFLAVAEKYRYWLASPDENAAIGIRTL